QCPSSGGYRGSSVWECGLHPHRPQKSGRNWASPRTCPVSGRCFCQLRSSPQCTQTPLFTHLRSFCPSPLSRCCPLSTRCGIQSKPTTVLSCWLSPPSGKERPFFLETPEKDTHGSTHRHRRIIPMGAGCIILIKK